MSAPIQPVIMKSVAQFFKTRCVPWLPRLGPLVPRLGPCLPGFIGLVPGSIGLIPGCLGLVPGSKSLIPGSQLKQWPQLTQRFSRDFGPEYKALNVSHVQLQKNAIRLLLDMKKSVL